MDSIILAIVYSVRYTCMQAAEYILDVQTIHSEQMTVLLSSLIAATSRKGLSLVVDSIIVLYQKHMQEVD